MGIILILFLLSLGIIVLCEIYGGKGDVIFSAIICTIISLIIVVISLSLSYSSYLNTRTFYDATIEQYRGAVTMYEDAAALDIEKAAFTDFMYKDYQRNVARMIMDLRSEVVRYNEELIRKRIMNRNFMFSWLIIAPDKDMKIIRMVEQLKIHDQKGIRP